MKRDEDRIEKLLDELEPVELPPFYRTRLLAKLREESARRTWRERLRSPRLAWSVAAACVVALAVLAVRTSRFTPGEQALQTAHVELPGGADASLASAIDPVSPVDSSVLGADDVEIVAAIYPPIEGGIVRLYVDDRDVTGLAEITEGYVMYSPPERFAEGEHIVTIEIGDGSGRNMRDVSWLFYTLNGQHAEPDESI